MLGYTRTTQECSPGQIHPSLYQAVREYFQTYKLGDVDTETLNCCETISEKRNSGKLASLVEGNPDSTTHLAILLTTEWLVWARNGDQTGTVVTGARLKVMRVKMFVTRRTKNMELEISGFISDSKEYVRGNLKMGPEVAAHKFCEVVEKAVSKANPPTKRKFLGLMRD